MLTAPPWFIEFAVLGWILLGFGAMTFWLGWSRRARTPGKLLLNLGAISVLAGAVEIGYWATQPVELEHRPSSYAKGYIVADPDLGYSARPGGSAHVERWEGENRIYSTDYTFDEFGTRRVPPIPGAEPTGSLLCFGGSFMMGEGLKLNETLPESLQVALGGHLRAFNFGLHGQGPHQMLSRLQSGRIEAMHSPPPKVALYWAIPDHISRAAGLRWWDQAGPLYEVQEDGRAERVGTFADLPGHPVLQPGSTGLPTVSWIVKRTMRKHPKTDAADTERWAAIVGTSRDEFSTRFPGCRFYVLLDDSSVEQANTMAESLRKYGIEPLRVSTMLPGFADDPKPWRLHPKDVHPTANAVATIAAALSKIIGSPD